MQASPRKASIHAMMKENKSYWLIKKQIFQQFENATTPITLDSIFKTISTAAGVKEQLRNLAISCIEKTIKRVPLEVDPVEEIESVRLKWCDNILMSFRTVTSKLKKDDEEEDEDESVNYVYDCLSFLDYNAKIKSTVNLRVRHLSIYMFPQQIIPVPNLSEIKVKFEFFNSPDCLGTRDKETLYREREKKAKKILDNDGFQNDIENYLLYGSTNGERMALYLKYFRIQPQQKEILLLQEDAKNNPHPIDKIFVADVADILNDSMYFIFRAEIKQVLKMFLRDKSIKDRVKIRPHTFNITDPELKELPANNIVPCQLFAKFIAPFCYCSMKVDSIYEIFREFYCEYFCLLQSISSTKNSALYLCILFEELLDSSERKIALYFSELGIKPLQLVFPWIFYCYIGYIDIQQIFYIMDRIVATKSLQILPLYAVSLLFKQKTTILQLKTFDQIQEALHKSMEQDVMQDTIKYYLAYHL